MPADPETRRHAERAEEWGDQVLQPIARRVVWAARLAPARGDGRLLGERRRCPSRARSPARSAPLVARAARRANKGSDLNVRADLAHLAHHLDRVDDWIARGVLGGEEPNVGDLQIGPSVALLASVEDLAPVFADRPALALARRWFPGYPEGRVPAGTLPAEWLSESASSSAWAAWATGPAAGSSTGA